MQTHNTEIAIRIPTILLELRVWVERIFCVLANLNSKVKDISIIAKAQSAYITPFLIKRKFRIFVYPLLLITFIMQVTDGSLPSGRNVLSSKYGIASTMTNNTKVITNVAALGMVFGPSVWARNGLMNNCNLSNVMNAKKTSLNEPV